MAEDTAIINRRKTIENQVFEDIHNWPRARVMLFMKHARLAEPHTSTLVADLDREYEREVKCKELRPFWE